MVKCQLCDRSGHEAKDCTKRTRKRGRDTGTRCQLCQATDHLAKDCTASASDSDGDADHSDEASASAGGSDGYGDSDGSDSAPESVMSCAVCKSGKNKKCTLKTCVMYDERLEAIETYKAAAKDAKRKPQPSAASASAATTKDKSKPATAAGAAAAAAAAAVDTTPPKPDAIMKMAAKDVAALRIDQIILLPAVFNTWINGGTNVAERIVRHQNLLRAFRASVLGPDMGDGGGARGKLSAHDVINLKRDLDLFEGILDPSTPRDASGYLRRIQTFIAGKGDDLVAARDARRIGWPIVRDAQESFRGAGLKTKLWEKSLAAAEATHAARKKTQAAAAAAAGGSSPRQARGARGGRGRKKKGGRGKGAKAGAADSDADG